MVESTAILKFDLHKEQEPSKLRQVSIRIWQEPTGIDGNGSCKNDGNTYVNNTDHNKGEVERQPKLEFFQLSIKSIRQISKIL